jgi:hypothetical protein
MNARNPLARGIAAASITLEALAKRRYLETLAGHDLVHHCRLANIGALEEPGPAAQTRAEQELEAIQARLRAAEARWSERMRIYNEEFDAVVENATNAEIIAACLVDLLEYWRRPRVQAWFVPPDGEAALLEWTRRGFERPDLTLASLSKLALETWNELYERTEARATARLGLTAEALRAALVADAAEEEAP